MRIVRGAVGRTRASWFLVAGANESRAGIAGAWLRALFHAVAFQPPCQAQRMRGPFQETAASCAPAATVGTVSHAPS